MNVTEVSGGTRLGIHLHSLGRNNSEVNIPDILSDLTLENGIKVIRYDSSWALWQPNKPIITFNPYSYKLDKHSFNDYIKARGYNVYYLNLLTSHLKVAQSRGIKVIINMGHTPNWASNKRPDS